ncbi:type II TA system antitoxin MqsA family protein [Bordetella genomosp. 13]|uniref:type II TA system antitoxin MqsA family protein n=1 Tax=Bordetella genomosp. 13 TaxID=463040 RepID=UPI0011A8981E|nr:type II TA system antitoxin MqsA family protein [Bordetella genomosp. 13]
MNQPVQCRRCRQGHMQAVEHVEAFRPPTGQTVEVRQFSARCDSCGKQAVLASQADENLRLRAARKAHYGEYLLGEDIAEFRRRWGLTQQQFSAVFGRGIIAFSRFETEKSYPDLTLTRFLKVAMRRPEVFQELADDAGIALPFRESARRPDEAVASAANATRPHRRVEGPQAGKSARRPVPLPV